MSGFWLLLGLAYRVSYEWHGLLLTFDHSGQSFPPHYLKNELYTSATILRNQRFDSRVKLSWRSIWLSGLRLLNHYCSTVVRWLSMYTITGIDLALCMIFLGVFSIAILRMWFKSLLPYTRHYSSVLLVTVCYVLSCSLVALC